MSRCKTFGYPDLFITITCNIKWDEIHDLLLQKGLAASDRPNIVFRIFKMKLDQMMINFKKNNFFLAKWMEVSKMLICILWNEILIMKDKCFFMQFVFMLSGMYTVEFKKKGLPHSHILL